MDILNVIKDCILKSQTFAGYETQSTNKCASVLDASCFSDYSTFKQTNALDSKSPSIDKKILQIYLRIWSTLGRMIVKSIDEGNCFFNKDIGYFFPLKDEAKMCGYSPTAEVLEKYNLKLIEDAYNISPTNFNVLLFQT